MRSASSAAWLLALVPTLALAQPAGASGQGRSAVANNTSVAPVATGSAAPLPGMPRMHDGLSWSVSLSNSLGLGTFVDPAYFASLGTFASVGANYLFAAGGRKVNVNAGWSVSYQETLNIPDTGRRLSPSDLRVGVVMPSAWTIERWGVNLSPSMGLILPTTIESWRSTMITAVSAGVSGTKRVGDLGLRLSLTASKNFYVLPFTPVPASALDQWNNNVVLCRTGEAYCGSAGINPNFMLAANGGVSWSFTEKLSASLSLAYSHGFRNAATWERDELTPRVLDANGNPVALVGLGRTEGLSGTLSVGYAVSDSVSIDFSLMNGGQPLMIDPATGQKMPRFPWFSWGQLAGNPTRAGFGLSASF